MNSPWPTVPIGNITEMVKRPEVPMPGVQYRQIGVRLWGVGAYEREILDGAQTQYKELYRVEADDIIVNKIWARNGSVAVVTPELAGCYASGEFPLYAPDKAKLEPRWFHWITKTAFFWQQCDEKSHGTSGKNRIRPERFLEIEIPLPPLPEQRRIVARVETLAAKVEAARELREEAAGETDKLLGSATEKLLTTHNWQPRKVEQFSDVRGGIQKSKARDPHNNPRRYLTVAHVQRNRIDLNDPRYFEVSDEELERWRLEKGDVLVVEGNGSIDQVGRTALYNGEIEDCVHQNHLIRVRPDTRYVLPAFLNLYFNSPLGRAEMIKRGRTTSGLYNLSVARIKSIEVNLPPLLEQHRIVAHLDALQAKLAQVQQHQAATQARLEALLPSILDRAFKGEL